jgi:type IV secretory pathway VirB2 component (pilin)
MAENHAAATEHSKHMEAHRQTYANFVTGSIIGTIACLYILVALAAVAFAAWGTLICWVTLIVGTLLLVLDAKSGAGKWTLSTAGLVLFSLLTAVSV